MATPDGSPALQLAANAAARLFRAYEVHSLAAGPDTRGMMRFLTEQYAEQLPVGCMLGYVLDGDVPFASSRIADAIGGHVPLALAEGPTPLAAIEAIERFRTRHTRPTGSQIELRHALFSKQSAAAPNA